MWLFTGNKNIYFVNNIECAFAGLSSHPSHLWMFLTCHYVFAACGVDAAVAVVDQV